jgi:hypothetical protein
VTELRVAFAPGVGVAVRGSAAAIRHLAAEYEPALSAPGNSDEPILELTFEDHPRATQVSFHGGHKTVHWAVHIDEPEGTPVRASIATGGRPRSFVLSMVQGYFVEALVAIAAADTGVMLIPAAAVASGDGATVIVGRSGAGKSTLCANLLATGHRILGDDQVFLTSDGEVRGFPRRLRLYPDIERTAPRAYRRLAVRDRARLALWRAAQIGSRGFVRPPIRVPPASIGAYDPGPRGLLSLALLERSSDVRCLELTDIEPRVAIDLVMQVVDEQRQQVTATDDEGWLRRVEAARRLEIELLGRTLERVALMRCVIPREWAAADAAQRLADGLGLGEPPQRWATRAEERSATPPNRARH